MTKDAHKKLYDEIAELIRNRSHVSGLVISALPDPYVMVRDLKRVLKRNKPEGEGERADEGQ